MNSFDPRAIGTKTMTKAYPELKRIREFEKLHDKTLRFVWYYAHPESPLTKIVDDTERCRKSIIESDATFTSDREKDLVKQLRFPDHIREAIDRMAKMNDGVRRRFNTWVDKILTNYELYINSYKAENADAYIAATQKITRELPNLLKLKEEGFAIQEEDTRRNASKGQDYAKNYLQSKEEL